jgi:hypothetical protein
MRIAVRSMLLARRLLFRSYLRGAVRQAIRGERLALAHELGAS